MGELFQHTAEIRVLKLQGQGCQIEAGNLKEFIDQVLKPFGFIQCNAGIAGTNSWKFARSSCSRVR